MLDCVAALLRGHLAPLAAQFRTLFRRHLPEAVERFAHLLLPFGRQALELLKALTQQLPLFRRHGAPLRKALLRTRALLRRHRQPALTALGQRLLPLGRQAVPLALMALQQLLLLWRQTSPGFRPCRGRLRRGGRGGCRRRRRALRETVRGEHETCQDYERPDHFFASCGGGAGGLFPRGGALFKNSHKAESPTSSEPRNSINPSSGGSALDAGAEAEGTAGGGGDGGGGCAAVCAAHAAPNN